MKKEIPLNQTFHGMRTMSDHILSDEYKMYGQDDLAYKQYFNHEIGIGTGQYNVTMRDTLAEECVTVDQWATFLTENGVAYYEDDFTPRIMSLKDQPQWVQTLWMMAHASTTDKVFGHVVRDLTFYIKPILLSKGMKKQWDELQSGKITREHFVKGKVEHATPVKELRQKILDTITPLHMLRTVMKHLQLVYVTLREDARIDASGYKASLPAGGTWHTRYNHSKVEVHPHPIKIPTKFVPNGVKVG
jgi:hypothetical protein